MGLRNCSTSPKCFRVDRARLSMIRRTWFLTGEHFLEETVIIWYDNDEDDG